MQCSPLEGGVYVNRYPGTAYKLHASMCHFSSVPEIEKATRA